MYKIVFIGLFLMGLGAFIWQQQQTELEQADVNTPAQAVESLQAEIKKEGNTNLELLTTQTPPVEPEFYQTRESIMASLEAARSCQQTGLCKANEQDPRASMFEQEKRLVDSLQSLQDLYAEYQHEDPVLAKTINEFISSPLGRVQFKALEMMHQQAPNSNNAHSLITTLGNSYDSKVMQLALKELLRYPSLSEQVDALLMKTLQTGSVYVSRIVAKDITPYLNANNLDAYQALANSLPSQAAKTKLLQSAINEYRQY
ncbi:hypothetical protein [uncultured Paraglaciecola sp.]|uniref:hypothetical protein n=1 Tax=uncultured Paraglaciecola sp. TaxID=1765024 RepID=UPI0030D7CCA6|tara:strand:+ start:31271 stop:32044 length:774 start_codon:yes stop_codon:yes gene_type:complete